jgi:transposase-like protein
LTEPQEAPQRPVRRYFSDTDKRAIVAETEQPGVSVSAVARRHGIVTGLLFRWRTQFGVTRKPRARLARVVQAEGVPTLPCCSRWYSHPTA